ncbi:hypothetical protein Tco_1087749 [Tanacetum coccineum]
MSATAGPMFMSASNDPLFSFLRLLADIPVPCTPLSIFIFLFHALLSSIFITVASRFKHGSSLKTSPLLYPELCHVLFEKCSASGSIRRPVAEKRPSSQNYGVKLVEIEDDVNNGSSKGPNVARGRRKKKSKKDSELGELEETMKSVMLLLTLMLKKTKVLDECHEKLKSMRLEPDDPVYLAATSLFGGDWFQHSKETIHNCFHEVLDKMLVFSEEVIRPTTFNPNPNIPGNNRRERRMFKGAVGALDGTLIHASVSSHKQNVYRGRGRGDCYHNVLAICDFNMIFTYIVAGWEGTAHDARILNEALDDLIYEFPIPPSDKYYLCDAAYRHTRGFMASYRNVRDITIACFAIHNFKRKKGLSDDFFAQYDQTDIHVNENVRDDHDGDVEVAQPIGREADQQYMINLRYDIATQIMQARS